MNAFFTPAQRASRATLPCSWMTQRACLALSSSSLSPSARPATLSSWPKYSSRPSDRQASIPELRPTTGMPAPLASVTALFIASGLARVTAMPSTRSRTASRTRLACPAESESLA